MPTSSQWYQNLWGGGPLGGGGGDPAQIQVSLVHLESCRQHKQQQRVVPPLWYLIFCCLRDMDIYCIWLQYNNNNNNNNICNQFGLSLGLGTTLP